MVRIFHFNFLIERDEKKKTNPEVKPFAIIQVNLA